MDDLQWRHHLWLLPCATIGHIIGLRFHDYALQSDTSVFFRVLGAGLLAVSITGLLRMALVLSGAKSGLGAIQTNNNRGQSPCIGPRWE